MIDNLFPTTVYYSDNNLLDSLDEYKSQCTEIINELERMPHPFGESSLHTSFWHQTYGHIYNLESFRNLSEQIVDQSVGFLNFLGFPGILPSKVGFLNMWVNVIGKHDYHAQHIHSTTGRAFLSGVFYVDAPKNSYLEFGSPYRDAYFPCKPPVDNYSNYSMMKYDCVPGRLIMFKSNVYHGYNRHNQDKNKISIPFNLAISLE